MAIKFNDNRTIYSIGLCSWMSITAYNLEHSMMRRPSTSICYILGSFAITYALFTAYGIGVEESKN
jgi:hypothetical protein